MRTSNPKTIAFINAIIGVIALAFFYTSFSIILFEFEWIMLSIIVTGSFVIMYFWNYYSLSKFIDDRIRLVYKSIRQVKFEKDAKPRRNTKTDIISEVSKEVEEWKENQLQEMDKLKENEKFRREFIGNVSHELRNPINNIQGYISTLLDGGIDDPKVNKKFLKRSEKSVSRIISILDDLDAISILESGEIKLNFMDFDLVETANEAVAAMDIKAEEREVKIFFRENYDKPIWVQGDKFKIKQAFINLIENSIKYGKYGGSTKVSFFDMDKSILIEITDDGEGIPSNELTRVFERFYRTERARSRIKKGSGLGLSIVKHILESHHQKINVRSTEGIGTTFVFSLRKAGK